MQVRILPAQPHMDLNDLLEMAEEDLVTLPRGLKEDAAKAILQRLYQIRQESNLDFYEPVSPNARRIHLSTAKEIITTGGNRSSKTDSHLAELSIQLTGVVPKSLEADYPREKIRPPIRARLVCTSLTNTWATVLMPKLQYWQWSGAGDPGSDRGHWGWIPKRFLKNGSWSDSWSEKTRVLTLTNGSTCQVMSYDQDVEDASGGSFHLICCDEGSPFSMYRENRMRTIDVGGRLMMAMTPPDDTSASWDAAWVYDELYCKGLPGPDKDPGIDAFTLFTEENRILSLDEVHAISRNLTPEQREVRLKGAFMHLGGRIYSTFTDRVRQWCFSCNDLVLTGANGCTVCSNRTIPLCHVIECFDIPREWPLYFALDPHPRKPHAMGWYVCTPVDELIQAAELEVDGEPLLVRQRVEDVEREHKFYNVVKRIMDPNMGKSPSGSGGRRNRTVQEDFADAGLRCDLADDNRDTARAHLRERLKPDPRTEQPNLKIFKTCVRTIYQLNRYSWDEWSRYSSDTRDAKPMPRQLHDDFPSLLQYIANLNPTFRGSRYQTIHRIEPDARRIY